MSCPNIKTGASASCLLVSLIPKGLEIGMEEAEFSWVSEANTLAVGSLEKGGAKLYKKYRLYDLPATEHLAKPT